MNGQKIAHRGPFSLNHLAEVKNPASQAAKTNRYVKDVTCVRLLEHLQVCVN
jgi:hypothetical protein